VFSVAGRARRRSSGPLHRPAQRGDEVIIDRKLPLLAKLFESRIRHTVEREAESMFRTT
jgi:hypothetical protein